MAMERGPIKPSEIVSSRLLLHGKTSLQWRWALEPTGGSTGRCSEPCQPSLDGGVWHPESCKRPLDEDLCWAS